MNKYLAVILLGAISCDGTVHYRTKREVSKPKGSEELAYKDEPGYAEYYKDAKANVKGDWMTKDVVIAKFWKLWGTQASDKIKKASQWRESRKDLPADVFAGISRDLDLDMSNQDKEGRVLLYQNNGKPDFVALSNDPVTVDTWLKAFDQIFLEASSRQMKKWEDKESEYTTITLLYNYQGFKPEAYLCLACVKFGKDLLENFEDHFPEVSYRVFIVNASPEFELFWNLIKIVLSPSSRERITVYGMQKSSWMPDVVNAIDVAVVDKLIK